MRPQRSRPQHLLTREKVAELIRNNDKDRRYADGGNLYLDVPASRGRVPAWVMRYKSPVTGKEREYRIGNEADYTLAHSRARAADVRKQLDQGIDPLDAREQAKAERSALRQHEEAKASATLKAEAEALHTLLVEGGRFKTAKAAKQWLSRLETNIPRDIWLKPIASITEDELKRFMEKLWVAKHATARKIRQRLDVIFQRARKHTPEGNIAASIKGDLRLVKNKHKETPHRSLPYLEVPAFVAQLRQRPGVSARALEFAILTSSRTSEVLGLEWRDVCGGVWTVPGSKMKQGEPHTVHLSKRAMAILEEVRGLHRRIVFPSEQKPHSAMSNMALLNLIARMGFKTKTTVHGICRGSFSAWAYSQQKWSEDTVESCLAHRELDRVKRGYAEGKNLAPFQADCWAAWAQFIDPKGGKQRARLKATA